MVGLPEKLAKTIVCLCAVESSSPDISPIPGLAWSWKHLDLGKHQTPLEQKSAPLTRTSEPLGTDIFVVGCPLFKHLLFPSLPHTTDIGPKSWHTMQWILFEHNNDSWDCLCPGAGGSSRQEGSRQLSGIRFKEGGFMPCDDDEDLCDIGSGNGDGGVGGVGTHSVFIPNQSDSK